MEVVPEIKQLSEKQLVGKHMQMSLTDNKTGELWRSFMAERASITNASASEHISLTVYEPTYFAEFNPTKTFVKWATVEVDNFDQLPTGLEQFILPAGMYAVFHYKGLSTDSSIFQYIFGTWLPQSGYVLANRPHFEVLGEKYKNNDPDSEEEIWIPIQLKQL